MSGRAEFIGARLGEDEAMAGKPRTWTVRHHDCFEFSWDPCDEVPCAQAAECAEGRCSHRVVRGSDGMTIYDEGGHTEAEAAHIARHDPARALRQVAAMRKLLNLAEYPCGEDCLDHGNDEHVAQEVPGIAIRRILAAIWDDHPDYPEAGR